MTEANSVVLRSLRISTTLPMGLTNLQMTDGRHEVTHHQHHQVHFPRRFLLGSRIRMRMHQRALVFFRTHVFKQPNELAAHKPLVIEPQDEPAPSKPIEPEVVHAVLFGIRPTRLLLPHSDDKIFSGTDEDVSSIRDGFTAWAMSDPSTALQLASKGCAKPIFREALERRLFSPTKIPFRQLRAQPFT